MKEGITVLQEFECENGLIILGLIGSRYVILWRALNSGKLSGSKYFDKYRVKTAHTVYFHKVCKALC